NSIIHSSMGYKVFDLKSRIYRQAIVELKERLESDDPHGITTKIRVQKLQNDIWSTTPIWKYNFKYYRGKKYNRLTKIITELKNLNIEIESRKNEIPITIKGGNLTIEDAINDPEIYGKIRKQLKKNNFMFIEQITNNNPNYVKLQSWNQIKKGENVKKIAKWYEIIKEKFEKNQIEINNEQIIKNQFIPIKKLENNKKEKNNNKNKIIATKYQDKKQPQNLTLGRIMENDEGNENEIIIEHYEQEEGEESEKYQIIRPCKGCHINEKET